MRSDRTGEASKRRASKSGSAQQGEQRAQERVSSEVSMLQVGSVVTCRIAALPGGQ